MSNQEIKSTVINFNIGKRKSLIQIQATVNDKGLYQFYLDTGASSTVISKRLAQELGYADDNKREFFGASGKANPLTGNIIKLESLTVGNIKLENIQVASTDLTNLEELLKSRVDGIIGYNFMQYFIVSINYPERKIEFIPTIEIPNETLITDNC